MAGYEYDLWGQADVVGTKTLISEATGNLIETTVRQPGWRRFSYWPLIRYANDNPPPLPESRYTPVVSEGSAPYGATTGTVTITSIPAATANSVAVPGTRSRLIGTNGAASAWQYQPGNGTHVLNVASLLGGVGYSHLQMEWSTGPGQVNSLNEGIAEYAPPGNPNADNGAVLYAWDLEFPFAEGAQDALYNLHFETEDATVYATGYAGIAFSDETGVQFYDGFRGAYRTADDGYDVERGGIPGSWRKLRVYLRFFFNSSRPDTPAPPILTATRTVDVATNHEYEPWPPPPTVFQTALGGDPPKLVKWRADAGLAIIFVATDVPGVAPFAPGYQIPRYLKCRVVKETQAVKRVPTIAFGNTYRDISFPITPNSPVGRIFTDRYGYLDDFQEYPAPVGAFCVHDLERLAQANDILVIGVDPFANVDDAVSIDAWEAEPPRSDSVNNSFNQYDRNNESFPYLQALSALSGAGSEVPSGHVGGGHVVTHNGTASDIAAKCLAVVQQYADARNTNVVDVMWTVDNSGSFGGRQFVYREAAVTVANQLAEAGFDAALGYSTHSEFSSEDWKFRHPDLAPLSNQWGSIGEFSFKIRFPFTVLDDESRAAFAAITYSGEGGGDTPETTLEALCRLYASREVPALPAFGQVHFTRGRA